MGHDGAAVGEAGIVELSGVDTAERSRQLLLQAKMACHLPTDSPPSPASDCCSPCSPSRRDHDAEKGGGLDKYGDIGPDPWRWWALFLYTLLSCTQSAAWATFSAVPVVVSKEHFPGQSVSEFTVNLLLNWGLITFVPALIPALCLQLQRSRGLQRSIRLAAMFTAAGAVLRCFGSVLCAHLAQILIGIAGPFVWNACGSFSSVWFPPGERTLATAIGGGAGMLGPALQFLFVLPVTTGASFGRFLWHSALFSVLVALLTFVALDAQPRRPPSASAAAHGSAKEQDGSAGVADSVRLFVAEFSAVGRDRNYWLLGVAAGVSSGLFGIFSSSFPIILSHDEGRALSKWLGFVSIVSFWLGSMVIGVVSDRYFQRSLKVLLLQCLSVCLLGTVIFMLALPSPLFLEGLAAGTKVVHFTSVAVLSAAMGGVFPLSIELAAEVVYPAEESTVVGAITGISNVAGMPYLFYMDRIPNQDVNLPMLAGIVAALVLVCSAEEKYRRRDADEGLGVTGAGLPEDVPLGGR